MRRKDAGWARRLRIETLEQRLVLDASLLRITELVASNSNGLTDVDGENSDWLEIYNASNDLVNMSGMYVTDSASNLTKWQVPAGVTIPAGGYRVVFASNKNGVLAGGELHTNFALSADGEFLALVGTDGTTIIDQYAPQFPPQLANVGYGRTMENTGAPTTVLATGAAAKALVPISGALGLTWTQTTFNDTTWPISGPTGLGYEKNPGDPINFTNQIATTLPNGIASAYIRVKFNLTSLEDLGSLTLRMKYDDGFAAYINGVRVAEANVPEVLQWNSQTGADRSDAQALVFEDFDVSAAIPHLHLGENVLAIHALNQPTGTDMLIVPELVAQRKVITSPEQFGYFPTPTPGYGNGTVVAGFVAEPTYSTPHGFYDTSQTVAISTSTPGAIVVYTTNGSTPQADANLNITNGTLYVNPLTISNTTTLRARAFRLNYEPSFVEASSYIFVNDVINQSLLGQVPGAGWAANGVNGQVMDYGIDPDIISLYGAQAVKDSLLSLSTFSITTDLANLFDPTTGIYVNAMNRGDSWERPATVELIQPDGSLGFEVNAGLRIRGGYSRLDFNPKHAFRLYFRSEYGDAKLVYPLFGDEGVSEFDRLDLRTEQNYSWSSEGNVQNSFVREVFARDTQGDMGSEYTRSRYHHLYINGVYWGIFMTQERVDENFAVSYFGGDESDYDVIKAGGSDDRVLEVSEGNDLAWRQLFDYGVALYSNPTTNANLYWTMQGLNSDGTRNESLPVLLDVDNLIDYMLIVFYTGGFDAPLSRPLNNLVANNWFGIYNRVTADQGFQFFMHDNEHSLGAENPTVHGSQNVDRTGPFLTAQNNYDQSNPQFLHQQLLVHPEYKQRFIDHVQKLFFNGGLLMPAANIERLMKRVDEVEPAVIAEAARWGDAKVAVPRNKSTWQTEINWLVNTYFPSRGNLVLNQLRGDGLYTTFAAPTFNQYGGEVPDNFLLTMAGTGGTIYYTTDGVTDPRAIGGSVNPSSAVQPYTGAVSISGTTTVKARLRTAGGQWSGLVEATFTVVLPGDYDRNGRVDQNDYGVWRASYGNLVEPGAGADGNRNGAVDTADYVLWRKNWSTAFSFNSIGQSYTQNFDSFRGSEQTLPPYFSMTADEGTDIFRGVFDSTTSSASAFTGIMATTTGGLDYSIGWRESTGSAELSDARLLFTFTNNTGEAITGFNFSYDVEAWVNGRRDNQLRFKYDIYANSAAAQAAAGRDAFETDVAATINPHHTPIANNNLQSVLDGKAPANRVTVSGTVDLTTLLLNETNPGLGVFGALLPGQTAYFRWQISNANLNDGNRSALAIDNLMLTPLAAGAATALAWVLDADSESTTIEAPLKPADVPPAIDKYWEMAPSLEELSDAPSADLDRGVAFDQARDIAIEILARAPQSRSAYSALASKPTLQLGRLEAPSSRGNLLLAARDHQAHRSIMDREALTDFAQVFTTRKTGQNDLIDSLTPALLD